MKNIKLFLIISLIFVSTTSFAAWTQPTATPPAGNTLPPINVGSINQVKTAQIGATAFCLYKPDGATKISCLGGGTQTNPIDFPWIINGSNIQTTNTGHSLINPSRISTLWGTLIEKLTVGGRVKAEGFCLGNDCVQLDTTSTTNQTTIVKNWQELISKYQSGLNFPVSIICEDNTLPRLNSSGVASCGGVSIFPAAIKICPAGNVIKVSVNSGVASAQCVKTPSPITAVCGNNQVLKWKEFYLSGTYYKTWVCADDLEGGQLTINNTTNTTNPLAGTINRIVKFTGSSSIGDSKLTDNGTFITNSVPVNTTGGFILENRTNDTVPSSQIGRMWIRSDI